MLDVITPATATPSFWTLSQMSATIRPRLKGAVAGNDAQLVEISEEIAREGDIIATGHPGALWYQEYQELLRLDRSRQWLYLQARPVAAVTSVAFGEDDPVVEGTEADEFSISERGLYRECGWGSGSPGWTVQYFGGYYLASMGLTIPAAIADYVDPATGHDRRALRLKSAAWRGIQQRWNDDTSPDPSLKRVKIGPMEREWGGRDGGAPVMSPKVMAVFMQEGASRRIGI